MDNTTLQLSLVSAAGMMFVAIAAVVFWRLKTGSAFRWFWIGAALWVVGVAIKFAPIVVVNAAYGFILHSFPVPLALFVGGLYGGLHSSLCEIGITWLAVLKWRQLGSNAERAIAVGIGAGAFEAFLLGLAVALAVAIAMFGGEQAEPLRAQFGVANEVTPVFWLVATAERMIAILCHASSRALVLLGVVYRRPWMVFSGFALFTALDGIVTAAHLSGTLGTYSMWWIELALLPCALLSIPILWWCYARWGQRPIEFTNVVPEPVAIG